MFSARMKIRTWFVIFLLFVIVFFSAFASATDVAYIYKNEKKIDPNVLREFSEMSFSVDLIDEKNLPSSFSKYELMFVGNERFSKVDLLKDLNVPIVLANNRYGEEFGLTDRDGMSKLSLERPLKIYVEGVAQEVYGSSSRRMKHPTYLYYVPEGNCANSLVSYATTEEAFSRTRKGSVIAYMAEGSVLENGLKAKENVCFFGIMDSAHWTDEAEDLFEDCVNYALGGTAGNACSTNVDCGSGGYLGERFCQDGNVKRTYRDFTCNNASTSQSFCSSVITNRTIETCVGGCENGTCLQSSGLIHNIGFVNITNTVGLLRLQTTDNEDIVEGETLQCNEKYKLIVRVKNFGNFSENVSFNGSLGSLEIDHGNVESLDSGDTSDRTKTVNFTLPAGSYNLTIESLIEGFTDANPADNIILRRITLACGEISGGACSSREDCPADSFSGLYCSPQGDSYKDSKNYTCENPGLASSSCALSTAPQIVEDCLFGCSNGNCLPEQTGSTHDISFVNVTNAVGLVRIRENNVDVPAGEHLECNHKYQIIVKAKNLGNFTENVTFVGSLGSLDLDYSDAEIDAAKTVDRTKTLNITLSSGTYNLDLEAKLDGFSDATPLNNFAHKQVIVDC